MSDSSSSSRSSREKFVVGIEIGSSRAKIGIAGFDPDDNSHTLTVYNSASLPTVDSVRYGRIKNIRDVNNIIEELVEAVQKKAPIENRVITGVYLNIGGQSLKSHKINANIVLPDRREITEDLIERLREEALRNLSKTDELISLEATAYKVDSVETPRPVGEKGSRLSGTFTAVTCRRANKSDLVDIIADRVGLHIIDVFARPIALAHLVLSPQETNAGCMLVDFGAETITVSIYKHYGLQYLCTIPLGSRLFTRDLATELALTEDDAEILKITMADAMPEKDNSDSNQQAHEAVNNIILARMADIIANIAIQPQYAGISEIELPMGIVLTGGGAKMKNFARLLKAHTHMKVRLATLPSDILIDDLDMSATDNLDLIALLYEAAEHARMFPDEICVSATQTETTPVEETSQTEGGFVIDGHQDADSEKQKEIDDKLVNSGYNPNDFRNEDDYAIGHSEESTDDKKPDHEVDEDGPKKTNGGPKFPKIRIDKILDKIAAYISRPDDDDSDEM
ncbi:MAG: pilus assembly protein PilM [Muribaculaceae bacterium]|nr:pilus assembly protein PilM [Muribaculaceae bacterium]